MDLKQLLGIELYDQVLAKAGDRYKIAVVTDGCWIPKDKFNKLNAAKKRLEEELQAHESRMSELNRLEDECISLKERLNALQNEREAYKEACRLAVDDLRTRLGLRGSSVNFRTMFRRR